MGNFATPMQTGEPPSGAIWQGQLDLTQNGGSIRINGQGYTDFVVEATMRTGSWGTAVVQIRRSVSDLAYYAFSPAKEISADGILAVADLAEPFLDVGVKTKDAAAGTVDIFVYARKDD